MRLVKKDGKAREYIVHNLLNHLDLLQAGNSSDADVNACQIDEAKQFLQVVYNHGETFTTILVPLPSLWDKILFTMDSITKPNFQDGPWFAP